MRGGPVLLAIGGRFARVICFVVVMVAAGGGASCEERWSGVLGWSSCSCFWGCWGVMSFVSCGWGVGGDCGAWWSENDFPQLEERSAVVRHTIVEAASDSGRSRLRRG